MKLSKEERSSIFKSNQFERKGRKREWNNLVRYCKDCFYKLEDSEIESSHPPGGCRKAQLQNKPINPQMFKILKERKKRVAP